MDIQKLPIKVDEQILLHILNFQEFEGEYKIPFSISQLGIAKMLNTTRSLVSYHIGKFKKKGMIKEKLGRIIGVPRKRKVYFLTEKGVKLGTDLLFGLIREGLVVNLGEESIKIKFKEYMFLHEERSFLEIIIENIEKKLNALHEIPYEDRGKSALAHKILDDTLGPIHEKYLEILGHSITKDVEESIAAKNSIVVHFDTQNLHRYISLWSLGLHLSRSYDVLIMDIYPGTTPMDVMRRFLRFLEKINPTPLQEILINEGPDDYFWEIFSRTLKNGKCNSCAIIIRNSPSWSDNNLETYEILMKIVNLANISLIMEQCKDGDGNDLCKITKPNALCNISMGTMDKGVLENIGEKLEFYGNDQGPYKENIVPVMNVRMGMGTVPVIQGASSIHGDTGNNIYLPGANSTMHFLDAIKPLYHSLLVQMYGVESPVLLEQFREKEAIELLAAMSLVFPTRAGFCLTPEIGNMIGNEITVKDIAGEMKNIQKNLKYLNETQILNVIMILLESGDFTRALELSTDWAMVLLERPLPQKEIMMLMTYFPNMDIQSLTLSRRATSLWLILKSCEEFAQNRNGSAQELAEKAALTGFQMKDIEVLARANHIHGKILDEKGLNEMALEKYVMSLNLSRGLNHCRGASLSALAIAWTFYKVGELNKAIAYIDIAAQADMDMFFAPLASQIYETQAFLYREKKLPLRTIQALSKASLIMMKTGILEEWGRLELLIGQALVESDRRGEALSHFEKLSRRAKEYGLGPTQLEAYKKLMTDCFKPGTTGNQLYKKRAEQLSSSPFISKAK